MCYLTSENSAEQFSLPYIFEYSSTSCLAVNLSLALEVDQACNLISAYTDSYYQWIEVEGASKINDVGICGKLPINMSSSFIRPDESFMYIYNY
ncbi:hypothetical protein EON65_38775 [archaeon]|nr:MAG: hypothetical protein EON65_38775 [archaeon]